MDLNSVIEESLVLVRHEFTKHNISLEKNLAGGLPQVGLDPGKVKQVFINMFMNAIQAMGSDGSLSVKTFRLPANESVVVQIEDTGSGIPRTSWTNCLNRSLRRNPSVPGRVWVVRV